MLDEFDDLAVLVVGFDPYIDIWNIFFDLLEKNWPERPNTYLACNNARVEYPNVKVIRAGNDAEWSRRVASSLAVIQEKYVCLLLEDFFVSKPVDNSSITEILTIIKSHKIKYYRLRDQIRVNGRKISKNYPYMHLIEKSHPYGINLQAAIWEKDFLIKAVGNDNYNAWVFEERMRNNKLWNKNGIDCMEDDRNPLNILHGVLQQKYLPDAYKALKEMGYDVDSANRKALDSKSTLIWNVKRFFVGHTPAKLRKPVKNISRVFGAKFVSDKIKK